MGKFHPSTRRLTRSGKPQDKNLPMPEAGAGDWPGPFDGLMMHKPGPYEASGTLPLLR